MFELCKSYFQNFEFHGLKKLDSKVLHNYSSQIAKERSETMSRSIFKNTWELCHRRIISFILDYLILSIRSRKVRDIPNIAKHAPNLIRIDNSKNKLRFLKLWLLS